MWNEYDADQNGYLDKGEAQPFLDEVAGVIDAQRAKNYNKLQFDEMFDSFDEDQNGFLSKAEMAIFIKKTFKNN